MDETTIVITPTIEIIIISKVVVISIVVAKVHNSFIEQKYFFHVVVQYITAISVRSGHIFANVYKTMQTNRHTNKKRHSYLFTRDYILWWRGLQ